MLCPNRGCRREEMDWFAEPVFGCVIATDPANHGYDLPGRLLPPSYPFTCVFFGAMPPHARLCDMPPPNDGVK